VAEEIPEEAADEPEPKPKPPPEPKPKRPKREPWMDEEEWLFIGSHHRLSHHARVVKLGYQSEALGLRKPIERAIPRGGTWIWKPDADEILRLQGLASCHGTDVKIKRPFFVVQPSRKALKDRPVGPPKKEK
jgi:hypothetical protein